MRRAASTPSLLSLVREHFSQFRLIRFISDDTMTQLAFPRAGLRCHNMARVGVVTGHFPGSRLLKTFGRTLMSL